MNERLGQFMREENITAAKLAEILQIQPSSISHLLSGRNKPNFDFIARILQMFTELNPDWLINGLGSMYRGQEAQILGNEQRETKDQISITNNNISQLTTENYVVTPDTNVNQVDLFTVSENDSERAPVTKNLTEPNVVEMQADDVAKNNCADKQKSDEIQKIIVFYSDQTFAVYNQRL